MLLLMNNSLVPWFILVPNAAEKEIYDLSSAEQAALMQEINTLSAFIKIIMILLNSMSLPSAISLVSYMYMWLVVISRISTGRGLSGEHQRKSRTMMRR